MRRHWLILLLCAALGYFGLVAAPQLVERLPAQQAAHTATFG